ncbi:hypothetical protein RCH18_003146 [Flavobacterium sp. PL11]|nr:hypothetical protein [Flavobacterium sp. PL11]
MGEVSNYLCDSEKNYLLSRFLITTKLFTLNCSTNQIYSIVGIEHVHKYFIMSIILILAHLKTKSQHL